MSTKDFTANVISATKVVPDGNFKDSKASGVWDINEVLDLIKGGNWPNAANINPAAFVDALFSTDVWSGNASTQTITNGIDLSNKGGLAWIKKRSGSDGHALINTVQGASVTLQSESSGASADLSAQNFQFNSNGYQMNSSDGQLNASSATYVGWTFREQPKFFDIVVWSGNGGGARSISHNLGSTPGMMLVKRYDGTEDWGVYHRRGNGGTNDEQYYALLHTSQGFSDADFFDDTAPTSTQFTVGSGRNISGRNYIAYLFAHNDDDGGFGEPGNQDIIKCGSYTGNTSGTEVDLGFEPQFVMIKKSSAEESWYVYDSMRGVATGGPNSQDKKLLWNSNNAESAVPSPIIAFSSKGFILESTDNEINGSGTYVYMAIRRGGMKTPTAASSVFNVTKTADNASTTAAFDIGFVSDFVIHRETDGTAEPYVFTRLLGGQHYLRSDGDNAEADSTVALGYDWTLQNSVENNVDGGAPHIFYNWKRARGYFDVVAYSGTGSGSQNVTHNLGVIPEMMWIKVRSDQDNWTVYHSALGNTKRLILNTNDAVSSANANFFNNTTPTASVFTAGTAANASQTYIAYLFATVAGVSKVGSFSHTNGSTTDVDCGFTGDTPSFVLLKRYNTTGSWVVFDSARGIVAGNDPFLKLDTTDAETTGNDVIDPLSGGFQVASGFLATGDWIFYAIAATS